MRIRCAKCDRIVDHVTIIQEPPHRAGRTIIAVCHGDRDEMFMPDRFLASLSREEMQRLENEGGVAFGTDRIAAASNAKRRRG